MVWPVTKALKVPASEVDAMALRLSARDQSLNAPIGDEGGEEWEDFLTDPGPTPEEQVMDRLDGTVRARWLTESLTELSQREQLIVVLMRLAELVQLFVDVPKLL